MDYIKQIEKALIYIENNLESPIRVDEVTAITNYSYAHFHRIFESMLGETVGHYIRSRRLTKAAHELLYTNRRIIDIAISLQFDSHESFSRAFKHYYKISPSEYRTNRINTLIGNRMPMTMPDLQHRYQNITIQPDIVERQSRLLIGFSFPFQNSVRIKKWAELHERVNEIRTIVPNSYRYGVFDSCSECSYTLFSDASIIREFIGVEVYNDTCLPEGMVSKTLSGGKFARFTHKGAARDIYKTYQYIWGTWIPYSQIELDERNDYECYTDKFLGINNVNSQIELYVPIK